jgi:uncharacterized protein
MATTPADGDLQLTPRRERIAPLWHTIVLVLFMFGYAYYGKSSVSRIENLQLASKVPLYLFMIVFEWALVAYVWFLGVEPAGGSFRGLIGGKWNSAGDVLRDIGVAFGFWIVVIALLTGASLALGKNPDMAKAAQAVTPRTGPEIIAWIFLALSAGFCEEFVFRGYFLKQFYALTGSDAAAIALQAAVFGVAHSYQGVKAMVTITLYGALFGILAVNRKSLRPGMIQHAMQDTFAGIAFAILRRLGQAPGILF